MLGEWKELANIASTEIDPQGEIVTRKICSLSVTASDHSYVSMAPFEQSVARSHLDLSYRVTGIFSPTRKNDPFISLGLELSIYDRTTAHTLSTDSEPKDIFDYDY